MTLQDCFQLENFRLDVETTPQTQAVTIVPMELLVPDESVEGFYPVLL